MVLDLNGYSFPDYQACEKGVNIFHGFEGRLCFFNGTDQIYPTTTCQ